MDGLSQTLSLQALATAQHTLKSAIGCVGIGLHSGRKVRINLVPMPADTGIVFRRTDLDAGAGPIDIPARFDHVSDTRLCTVVSHPERPEARVGTIEHLMAALAGCGVHNLLVEIDGPEVPIFDGSSDSFVFLIDCAGVVEQAHQVRRIEVLRTVRVEHGESFVELRPSTFGLDISISIEFAARAIGKQALSLHLDTDSFRAELARARTFAQANEVAALRAAGLALGGSLANAIVVDGDRVLNHAGLRMTDEFVRHKMLDAVGDLALAGGELSGRVIAYRSGHALNNRVLRALFADDANWRLTGADRKTHTLWQSEQVAAAA